MNVLNAIKVAELRKKLAYIPGKIIIALLMLIGIFLFRHRTLDMSVLWEQVKCDWLYYCGALVFIYGVVSYFAFFMQIIKQWFLGLVVSIGLVAVLYFTIGRQYSDIFLMIVFGMVFIGPLFDVINFFRYLRLKNEVIEAEEELKQGIEACSQNKAEGNVSSFGDGFEEGYRRGLRAGKRDAEEASRRIEREYEEPYTEELEDGEYYDGAENSRYDDESEDGEYYDGEDGDSFEYKGAGEAGYEYESGDEGRHEEKNEYNRQNLIKGDSSNVAGYFADCKNKREVKRRYHDLSRVYHPDSGNASSDIFCKIHAEYMVRMNQYED